ncbi:hypothetical protein TWF506_008331 [Arthrobotrys conoides]|uniref:Uncharacterized protein n=1 Tax=Arthrobotrys conoides TaxID=74498 RepID=A0AAN8PFK0_9PEZI
MPNSIPWTWTLSCRVRTVVWFDYQGRLRGRPTMPSPEPRASWLPAQSPVTSFSENTKGNITTFRTPPLVSLLFKSSRTPSHRIFETVRKVIKYLLPYPPCC